PPFRAFYRLRILAAVPATIGVERFATREREANARLTEQGQFLGADAAASGRQGGHDLCSLSVAESRPACDLGQCALAAETEPALAIDDANFDAGRLDQPGGAVHPAQMAQAGR